MSDEYHVVLYTQWMRSIGPLIRPIDHTIFRKSWQPKFVRIFLNAKSGFGNEVFAQTLSLLSVIFVGNTEKRDSYLFFYSIIHFFVKKE